MSERLERIQKVMREVLDLPDLVIGPKTAAPDVPGWDSVAHLGLIVAMEREFGIRFDLGDLRSLKNVGDWDDLIGRKLA